MLGIQTFWLMENFAKGLDQHIRVSFQSDFTRGYFVLGGGKMGGEVLPFEDFNEPAVILSNIVPADYKPSKE